MWSDDSSVVIPKKFRRDLARSIVTDDLFSDWSSFERLLDRFWVLESSPLDILFGTHTLRSEIERHVVRNPGDWTTEYLFQALGAFECTDKRFALFIEGATYPDVQTDEARQRTFVERANQVLRPCGGKEDKLDVVLELGRRSEDPDAKLNMITAWLDARPDVERWKVGEDFDIWYGDFQDIDDQMEQND